MQWAFWLKPCSPGSWDLRVEMKILRFLKSGLIFPGSSPRRATGLAGLGVQLFAFDALLVACGFWFDKMLGWSFPWMVVFCVLLVPISNILVLLRWLRGNENSKSSVPPSLEPREFGDDRGKPTDAGDASL